MTKWQPIETAPKDGKTVLVYADLATVPMLRLASWLSAEMAAELGEPPENEGWWSFYSSCTSERFSWKPTHWAVWEAPQ